MHPFFSIITPVYNCCRFLKKCIESVINQSFKSWELILIDDGSTDSSGNICDEFCLCDARIRVIHQSNMGALQSRINGIAAAQGIYGIGLDADDYLDRKCLEIIKNAIDISHSDLIFFGFRYIGGQKGSVRCCLSPGKIYSQKEILKEIINKTNHALWNKAIKMDSLKQADYSGLSKRLSVNLDYAQIIPIVCNINTAYVINDILYNYRIYGNSISHLCKVQHITDTAVVSEVAIHKLKQHSLLDLDVYNMIILAYLKMIAPRLSMLFGNKKISLRDCRDIHNSNIYIKSEKVELLKNFNKYDYMFLKLFRYKQYSILKLIVKSWNILYKG